MHLVSGKLMSEIDKWAIGKIGIPGTVLMENAGKGVFEKFIEKFNPDKFSHILILTGKGNNGGDGFVIARWLYNYGYKNFKVILLAKGADLKGDAKINYQISLKLGIDIYETDNFNDFCNIVQNKEFDFIFDAILGTGLNSEVRDFYKQIIEYVNKNRSKVIAVDIPSGLHSEKGIPLGYAVNADLTCTFAYKKIGLSTYPGAVYSGDVEVINISIPENIPFKINHFEIDDNIIRKIYQNRKIDGHKGTFGHVAVLGGSIGYTGAVVLAGKSALESGSGLVTLIVPENINTIIESMFTEGISYPINFNGYDKQELIDFINKKSCIIIGPGMGQNMEAEKLLSDILEYIKIPIILDADGINIIAKNPDILEKVKTEVIITPHPGEMSRLTGLNIENIQNNRIDTVKNILKKYKNIIVVLKGYRTIIGYGNEIYISPRGNSGMATAGSGDVLSGMIGSFSGQGYSSLNASILSVYFHGIAGEIAGNKKCVESVTASDIINNIHYAIKITLF